MSRHFDLYVQEPGEGDLAGPPRCHIELTTHTPVTEVRDEKEVTHILIGAGCVGPHELKGQVNRLKNELDRILGEGRRLYKTRT